MKLYNSPQLFANEIFYEKLFELAKRNIEWTLYARTERVDNRFYITDFIVPYQINTGANTEVPNSILLDGQTEPTDAIFEWRTRDKDMKQPSTWRDPKEWNLLIHSHHTMGAFWSGTDEKEMQDMAEERNTPYLSLVVSTKDKGEYKLRIVYPEVGLKFDEPEFIRTPLPSLAEYLAKTPEEQESLRQRITIAQSIVDGIDIDKYEQKPKYQTAQIGFNYNKYYDDGYDKDLDDYGPLESYGKQKKSYLDKCMSTTVIRKEADSRYDHFKEQLDLWGEGYFNFSLDDSELYSKAIDLKEVEYDAVRNYKDNFGFVWLEEGAERDTIEAHFYWPNEKTRPPLLNAV